MGVSKNHINKKNMNNNKNQLPQEDTMTVFIKACK